EVDGEEESVEYDDREGDVLDLDKLVTDDRDSQVIRMVNYVMRQAIEQRASDIHIEPLSESVSIRYRVDGELQAKPAPPKSMFTSLVSRLKILSKLDIAERRLPQDGAFSMLFKQNQIDVRVSTVPTVYGEKVVMRLLNKNGLSLDHKTLGFNDKQCASFIATSKSPHGLIFVTGPTGSGKSTTLYATLNLLNSPTKNLVTVEDPVEYKMDGINQVQVHAAIGLTFAGALRSFLRQDPDVIMVGEVRDQETAEICLRAALTGHLVLSTLHTNNALAAIDRLVDMGIEPFLVASTLRLVEAQRLIRRLCDECKEAYVPAGDVCEEYGLEPGTELYHAKGCDACGGLGYRGRVGIFEVIQITAKLRDMIQAKAPLAEVQAVAEEEGMQSLLTNGLEKVRDGITSLDELCKATMEGDE
ncbi:MAG: GspE/PulE family protein, partial [Candidatus Binatia bacterium]